MSVLHDAYTAWLSGLTHKMDNEIHWEDEYGRSITVELVDADKEQYIIRRYYENGKKWREENYQNGKAHGKHISWHENGQKYRENNYQNNLKHGKCTVWYENGQKELERSYENGNLHGDFVVWFKDGQERSRLRFKHGKRVPYDIA